MPFIRPTKSSSISLPFTTNFSLTENPISQGNIWDNGLAVGLDWQNVQTTGNGAFAATETVNSYDDATALIKSSYIAFDANQYVQGTIYHDPTYTTAVVDGHELELRFRSAISAHSCTGYECYLSLNNGITVVRWNGSRGDFTPIIDAGSYTPTTGDVLRVEMVGSNITVKINGVVKGTGSDSTYSSGQPGIGVGPYPGVTGANLLRFGWSAFEAGNF